MRYLVDGHNLVPHIPGLSLQMEDDEQRLVHLLQNFCRERRAQVEVYFDQAAFDPGSKHRFGSVTAYFIRRGQTADAAILKRLIGLGRSARQWCVVSSDQRVRAGAREAQAQLMQSDEFARLMLSGAGRARPDREKPADVQLGEEELQEWLKIFKRKDLEK